MASPGRPIAHRARTDMKFLIESTPPVQPRIIREGDQVSRSYPGSSPMSPPIVGSPPSPLLQPERPPRSMSPDNWTLSSPNTEMPSPLRNAVLPMLNLAREVQEEAYADQGARENRSSETVFVDEVSLSRRNSSRVRSTPTSPPNPRAQTQGYRKYRSPRVETDSEPEEGVSSHSWRMPTFERVEPEAPRTPPPPPPPQVYSGSWTSPRKPAKSRSKRNSVAQRRIMEAYALSSDSGIAGSPLCQSPLVALPLPDIPPSASEAERAFFPPERPVRSQQRPSSSPIPSPSQSPLALQPLSLRAETPRSGRDEGYRTQPTSPVLSSRGRASPSRMSAPMPLSPGSTLAAQTRPPSPAFDARASPHAATKSHGKQSMRSPSPMEEPAVRHSEFYMQDEMVTLRVENTLFRVHRYFLERDSTFFKDFFQRTLIHGAGMTDESAVRLPDVSRREFECLLHFLYHGASSPLYDSILNLVLLLSTASTLSFPAARTHAITALDAASPPLDPVERVFLAEKYGIPAWLRPAYVALCSRAHPLEDTEAEVLGLQTTARLARAREAVLEEKVQEWRRAVERTESGQGFNKEDMEVREARLVEKVVDDIFALAMER